MWKKMITKMYKNIHWNKIEQWTSRSLAFPDEATSFHKINEAQFKSYLREVLVWCYLIVEIAQHNVKDDPLAHITLSVCYRLRSLAAARSFRASQSWQIFHQQSSHSQHSQYNQQGRGWDTKLRDHGLLCSLISLRWLVYCWLVVDLTVRL